MNQNFRKQIFIEFFSALFVFFLIQNTNQQVNLYYFIGGVAFFLSVLVKNHYWWHFIHLVFMPGIYLSSTLHIHPIFFLFGFFILFFTSKGAIKDQVPLFLSNKKTNEELYKLVKKYEPKSFLDIGSGISTTLVYLAKRFIDMKISGVENSYLTYKIGTLRLKDYDNAQVKLTNLWDTPLKEYDFIYAFLSPSPMEKLWVKIKSETNPGTIFVSNSFPVPNVNPETVIEVEGTNRKLYVYQV